MVVSGLGVAAFHPEGAKFAGLASRERQGRGMSLFSVGGNAGFALGPLLTTPLVLVFGLVGHAGAGRDPARPPRVLIARELGAAARLESARRRRACPAAATTGARSAGSAA